MIVTLSLAVLAIVAARAASARATHHAEPAKGQLAVGVTEPPPPPVRVLVGYRERALPLAVTAPVPLPPPMQDGDDSAFGDLMRELELRLQDVRPHRPPEPPMPRAQQWLSVTREHIARCATCGWYFTLTEESVDTALERCEAPLRFLCTICEHPEYGA